MLMLATIIRGLQFPTQPLNQPQRAAGHGERLALTSLRVYYQTRNSKNFARELFKSKTSENGVLNVESFIENIMEVYASDE